MRWYWTKIALGALVIFGVGFVGLTAVRSAKSTVEGVVRSNADLSIPLPFVPFMLDGVEAGKFRRLVLHRSGAEHLSGIDLSIRMEDAAAVDRLLDQACHLTVDDPKRLGSKTSFRCVEMDSAMRMFGEVRIQVRDAGGDWATARTVPFVLPHHVVVDLEGLDVAANAAGAEAAEIQALAAEIAAVSAKMAAASAADRSELRLELRRLRTELREVEAAAAQVARSTARVRVSAPGVKIEVSAPEAPAVPDVPPPATQ